MYYEHSYKLKPEHYRLKKYLGQAKDFGSPVFDVVTGFIGNKSEETTEPMVLIGAEEYKKMLETQKDRLAELKSTTEERDMAIADIEDLMSIISSREGVACYFCIGEEGRDCFERGSNKCAAKWNGGKGQREGSRQAERDLMKNNILDKYEIPYIRFGTRESGEEGRLTEALKKTIK